jgi:hypothetical protein
MLLVDDGEAMRVEIVQPSLSSKPTKNKPSLEQEQQNAKAQSADPVHVDAGPASNDGNACETEAEMLDEEKLVLELLEKGLSLRAIERETKKLRKCVNKTRAQKIRNKLIADGLFSPPPNKSKKSV